ncbi:Uncharacterised protein [uncultured archaeon]|nr:Uncharacterised protein [uncultured archaeon]
MAEQVEGLKIKISADVAGAIAAINNFHNTFKNMASSINGTVLNVQGNMNNFSNSIQDVGSLKNIEQMQHLQDSFQRSKKPIEQTTKSLEKQNKVLVKMKSNLLAVAVAIYAVVKVSTLMNLWMSEGSQILGYFIDTALLPLSPIIEGILTVMWAFTDWFAGLSPIIQGAVGAFGLIAGAIAIWTVVGPTVMAVLTTLGGIFTWLGGVLGTIGTAIAGVAVVLGIPFEALIAIIVAVGVAIYLIATHWEEVKTAVYNSLVWLGTQFSKIWEGIKSAVTTAWEFIKNTITGAIQGAYNIIVGIVDKIKSAITSIPGVSAAINIATNAYKSASSYMGYAQGTDYVPSTGLYKLHSGEAVIPKGGNSESNVQTVTFNVTNNISANIKGDQDIRQLASQISSSFRNDMQRYVRGTV